MRRLTTRPDRAPVTGPAAWFIRFVGVDGVIGPLGFGGFKIPAIISVAQGRGIIYVWGNPTYGDGPFERIGVPRPGPGRADADLQPARLDARRGHYVHGNALRAVRRPPPHHPHRPARRRTLLRQAVLQLAVGPPRAGRPVHRRDGQPDRRVQDRCDIVLAAGWHQDDRGRRRSRRHRARRHPDSTSPAARGAVRPSPRHLRRAQDTGPPRRRGPGRMRRHYERS